MPVEAGQVVEAGLSSRLGGDVLGQEKSAGTVDGATDDVLMRGDAIGLGEDPDQMTAMGDDLNLVGVALRGPKNAVDRVVTGR